MERFRYQIVTGTIAVLLVAVGYLLAVSFGVSGTGGRVPDCADSPGFGACWQPNGTLYVDCTLSRWMACVDQGG